MSQQVGSEVRVVQGPYFGKIGRLIAVCSVEEARESYGLTHTVTLQLWGPVIERGGGSIVLMEDATPETIERVKASGEPYRIDSGVHPYGFRECELKLFRDSREPFWAIYEEREYAQRCKNVRQRANRACNLWRCHKPDKAVELAQSSHPMNLLLSATDSPRDFKGPRLGLDKCVALCRAAGKTEGQLADLLFHMFFENREVYEVGEITPHCTCTLN